MGGKYLMHTESFQLMEKFVLILKQRLPKGRVLDVGSLDVNGTYKQLFLDYEYIGLDLCVGNNVDLVSKGPYDFGLESESFDVVISGNTLEHVEMPWLWVLEIDRVLKSGGYVCCITPYKQNYHPYPVDCWRILKDGVEAIWVKWFEYNKRKPYKILINSLEDKDSFFVGQKI